MTLRAVAIALTLATALLGHCDPWDQDSLASIFEGKSLEPIEGVWQFPADGARLLIERSSASTFDIRLLESSNLRARPGVWIGTASATAQQGVYDATLDARELKEPHINKAQAVLRVTSDGTLSFAPYSKGKKINLRRWIPYMLRVVDNNDTRPANLDGARRIYPLRTQDYKPCL